jgi:hypothetical protein
MLEMESKVAPIEPLSNRTDPDSGLLLSGSIANAEAACA